MFTSLNFPWDWVLVLLTVIALVSLKKPKLWAVSVGVAAEAAWIWYAIVSHQYGFIAGAIILGIPIGYNVVLWWGQESKDRTQQVLKHSTLFGKKTYSLGSRIVEKISRKETNTLQEVLAMRAVLIEEYPWAGRLEEDDSFLFASEALNALRSSFPKGNYQHFSTVVEQWKKKTEVGS